MVSADAHPLHGVLQPGVAPELEQDEPVARDEEPLLEQGVAPGQDGLPVRDGPPEPVVVLPRVAEALVRAGTVAEDAAGPAVEGGPVRRDGTEVEDESVVAAEDGAAQPDGPAQELPYGSQRRGE